MGALNNQVGGDYYKNMKYQPILVCNVISRVYGFTGGDIAKYLCRYPYKGKPVEDLQKALHCIDLHRATAYLGKDTLAQPLQDMADCVEAFITGNNLPGYHAELLRTLVVALISNNFSALINRVKGEIATFPQCGDAVPEQPSSLGSAPATKIDMGPYDLKYTNLSAGAQIDKIVRDLVREQDQAAMSLVKQGYSDIRSCVKYDVDGTVAVNVWGTK